MKRSGPIKRKTPLKRTDGLKADPAKAQAWRQRSKPLRSRPKRRTPAEIAVREAVFARDRYRCLLAGHGRVLGVACFGEITYHHLLKEGQGGAYTMENGATICCGHQGGIEDHPAEALELGLVVRPGVDHAEAERRRRAHSVVPK